jgi:hypothetical protein
VEDDAEQDAFVPVSKTTKERAPYVKIELGDDVFFTISHFNGKQCKHL